MLWASTSTKNPNYRDVLYVEELIGPDTVNTIPPATLDAFRDHGKPRQSLTEDVRRRAEDDGRSGRGRHFMKEVTDKLTDDGVKLFADAFDKLLAAVEKNTQAIQDAATGQSAELQRFPPILDAAVKKNLDDWRASGKVRRACGSTTPRSGPDDDEANWLGWLDITDEQLAARRPS